MAQLLAMQPADMSIDPDTSFSVEDYTGDINVREYLVEYLGTGDTRSLNIPNESLVVFLNCAVCLNNNGLKQYCEDRLIKNIHPYNSLDMFLLAQAYRCDNLQSKSTEMLANNFGIIWNTEAFQHLGKNELKRLLELPQIYQHQDIENALTYWMEYERDFREESYRELVQFLNEIRSTLSPSRFNPYRKSIRRCRKFPRFAVLFSTDINARKAPSTLVIDLRTFNTYHKKVKQMQGFRDGFAVCFLAVGEAPYIYISGGCDPKPGQMLRYDVILSKWKDCKKMSCCRLDHSMVAAGERIYVIGGHNEKSILSSIEEYNPQTNSWKTVGQLQQPVRSTACAVYKDKIYIFGGKLFDGRRVTNVQCFDHATKRLCRLQDLPSRASSGKALVVDDQIFYASGQGELYRFDPESKQCHVCSPPPIKLRKFAVFTDTNLLFIACGIEEKSGAVDCLLKYKPKTDMWACADSLQVALPVHANCTVEFPHSFSLVPFKD